MNILLLKFGRKQGLSNEKMMEALESAGEIEPFNLSSINQNMVI